MQSKQQQISTNSPVTRFGGALPTNFEPLWNLCQSVLETQFDTGEEAATFSWKAHDGTGAGQMDFHATVFTPSYSALANRESAGLRIFALYLVSQLESKQLLNVCKYAADEFAWQINAKLLPATEQHSRKLKSSVVRQVTRPTVSIEEQ